LAGLLKFYKRERERNCWKLRKNFFTFWEESYFCCCCCYFGKITKEN
jgi:REP element-mobilizing transposase RayT